MYGGYSSRAVLGFENSYVSQTRASIEALSVGVRVKGVCEGFKISGWGLLQDLGFVARLRPSR